MRERTMKFSQDWKKLDDRVFTTIRMHKTDAKFIPGQEVNVVAPTKRLSARVVFSCDWKLGKLYGWLDPPEDKDIVTIYLLERI